MARSTPKSSGVPLRRCWATIITIERSMADSAWCSSRMTFKVTPCTICSSCCMREAWHRGDRVSCARSRQAQLLKIAAQQAHDQLAHAADLAAEGQCAAAAEEQAALHITVQRRGELLIDAELAPAGLAVTQAALREAVED